MACVYTLEGNLCELDVSYFVGSGDESWVFKGGDRSLYLLNLLTRAEFLCLDEQFLQAEYLSCFIENTVLF